MIIIFFTGGTQYDWMPCPLQGGYDFIAYLNERKRVRKIETHIVVFNLQLVVPTLLKYRTPQAIGTWKYIAESY